MNFDPMLLLPIYLPIALGFLARISGYFPADFTPAIRQFCLKIAIPLLVFVNMAELDTALLSQVLPVTLSLPVWMGLMWIASLGLSFIPLFRRRRFEAILAMILFNIGYVGWAVCDIALGPEGLVRSVMFATLYWPGAFIYAFLTHLVIDRSKEGFQRAVGAMKVAIPVMLAFVFGLAMALLEINLPGVLVETLSAFGQMTSPLILFGVGLSISFKAHWGELSLLLPLRLLLGFSMALLTVRLFPGLDGMSRKVILIVSLMPVGANSAIIGDVLGLDESWISGAITLSTLLALVTIPLSLLFLA